MVVQRAIFVVVVALAVSAIRVGALEGSVRDRLLASYKKLRLIEAAKAKFTHDHTHERLYAEINGKSGAGAGVRENFTRKVWGSGRR